MRKLQKALAFVDGKCLFFGQILKGNIKSFNTKGLLSSGVIITVFKVRSAPALKSKPLLRSGEMS